MVTALGSCVKWPLVMPCGSVTTLIIPISEGGFNDECGKLVKVILNVKEAMFNPTMFHGKYWHLALFTDKHVFFCFVLFCF
jgi:hypothetical protein